MHEHGTTSAGVFLLALAGLLVGCSDNPNDRAAKELRRQVAAARAQVRAAQPVEVVDREIRPVDRASVYAVAHEQVEKAIGKTPRTVEARGPAFLAAGNLAAGQAEHLRMGLNRNAREVRRILAEILTEAGRATDLANQIDSLSGLQQALRDEEATLEKLLVGGVEGQPGLRTQLQQAEARRAALQEQKTQWMAKHDAAQAKIQQMQADGQARLKQAELLTGDEQAKTRQRGYELLVAQKPYLIEAQNASDQARSVQMQLDIVEPLIEQIRGRIAATEQKMQAVRTSPEQENLATQLEQTRADHKRQVERVAWLSGELSSALDAYTEMADTMISLYGQAAEAYGRAPSGMRRAAGAPVAEAHMSAALVAGEKAELYQTVQWQIGALEWLDQSGLAVSLEPVVTKCRTQVEAAGKVAMELFDKAAAQYETQGTAASVQKRALLCLYAKMMLADRLANIEAYEAAETKAGELMDQLVEADPVFAKSPTVHLFRGLVDYVPQLPVDKTAYYEDLKAKFQTWKGLRGQAAETEVNRLLEWHDQLVRESDRDPELMQVLQPIYEELQDALAKGFPEVAAAGGAADANSVPRRR
ncbi:MAG TPA: hypothetical protein ENN87_06845 [Phycisphaerales bacterium]|nr:hypothetical protein [Phycisphaerales bacterium]